MSKSVKPLSQKSANKLQMQANAFTHQVPVDHTLDSPVHRSNHYLVEMY